MNEQLRKKMLFSAACFNWLAAVALLVFPDMLLQLFRITPLPTEPLFLHMFAALVFVFGVGYFSMFPQAEKLEARTITSRGQSAVELTPASARLTF